MKGMLACVSIEEFLDFTLKIVECSMRLMRKKSESSGTPVTQHVFIFDLDGFSLITATHGPTIEILQRLISVYEANYPETLKAAYVLYGTGGWRETLLRSVQADILPVQW